MWKRGVAPRHESLSGCILLVNFRVTSPFICFKSMVEVLATSGETIVLPCDPKNHQKSFLVDSSVRWYKDGIDVKSSIDGRYYWNSHQKSTDEVSNRGHFNIRISDVTNQDGGVWQCQQITNQENIMSQPIKLIIASIPNHPVLIVGDEEEEVSEASVINVTEGDDFKIMCIVENGNPPSKQIYWILDKKNITSKNKPSFILSRSPGFGFPIVEGTKVSLHCKINSNPPSRPYWVKDVGTLQTTTSSYSSSSSSKHKSINMNNEKSNNDGFINFTLIKREDSGWYRCSTDHKLGHFASFGYFLSVKHAPQIVAQPPKTVEGELGDDVLLECDATGTPPPSYCWSRIRDRIEVDKYGTKKISLESMGLEKNLLLDRLLYSDSGTYKCTASNRIGMSHHQAQTHSVKLTVMGKPMVEPINRAVRVIAGRPASLSVQICANPLPYRIHWIIGHLSISPGHSIPGYKALNVTDAGKANCFISSIEIDSVKPGDAGEIIVIAKNSKGVNDGVILVNLTTASYSKSSGLFIYSIFLLSHNT
ncbi:Hemicentin-2 [Nymphon striatum]|nr:Hemicentin-2 [Nymphon striatum]